MRSRHSGDADPGNAIWTTNVSRCIDALGSEHFSVTLGETLERVTLFDNTAIYAYYESERPICLFSTFLSAQSVLVDDYLKGLYQLDPFFKARARQTEAGLY